MDFEKFYELHYGNYCVRFLNKTGLSIKEIQEIFSEYGQVVTVKVAGDQFGIHFVKYKTSSEAINCINGLQNHKFIKLLPKRPKQDLNNKIENNKSTFFKTQQSHSENHSTHNFIDKKSDNTPIGNQSEYLTNLYKNKLCLSDTKNESAPITNTNGCNNKYFIDPNIQSTKKPSENFQESLFHTKLSTSLMPNKEQGAIHLSKTESFHDDESIYEDRMPPPLVTLTEATNAKLTCYDLNKSIKDVEAQEIIVANIPLNFSTNYILHLFQNYKPICATLVKTLPKSAIRYCHVYFKTKDEALQVEKHFDEFFLGGNKLIVLRKQQLIVEANSSLHI